MALKPDRQDPLKIRRFLALWIALYAFVVWPHLILIYVLRFALPETLAGDLLLYVGTLAAGPIGAYLWAAQRKDALTQYGGVFDMPRRADFNALRAVRETETPQVNPVGE